MNSFLINNKICNVNIVSYEDKCGLRDDGTYLISYTGWNVDFHYDDKEILSASISEEGPHIIRFKSSPFPTFGKDIEIVKEYLQEKHGIKDFRYYDPDSDEGYINF
ncbi:hypothetical protein GY31_09340 [Lysinibacillus sphaericus]|uniref:hypothetical protein n=1 Tax=Lysinibacillus TaxID=400634 RepID=UPI00084A6388|nr:hypothetical protein [Lysinibacillus sphaericus]OEC02101.1 hypothetical protein GY31_09340 [Lysinibacillus sphaericus]